MNHRYTKRIEALCPCDQCAVRSTCGVECIRFSAWTSDRDISPRHDYAVKQQVERAIRQVRRAIK